MSEEAFRKLEAGFGEALAYAAGMAAMREMILNPRTTQRQRAIEAVHALGPWATDADTVDAVIAGLVEGAAPPKQETA